MLHQTQHKCLNNKDKEEQGIEQHVFQRQDNSTMLKYRSMTVVKIASIYLAVWTWAITRINSMVPGVFK